MSYADRWGLIQASPKAKSSGSSLSSTAHCKIRMLLISSIRLKIRWRIYVRHTQLPVDDSHIRNPLIAVIITHSIEFLGAHIDSWCLQFRFTTYLCINLQCARKLILNPYKINALLLMQLNYLTSKIITSVIISPSCLTVTSLLGLPTLNMWPLALAGFSWGKVHTTE